MQPHKVSSRWTHDVWLDGKFVAAGDALASIMSHGMHYGTGVFEGIRFYGRKPFLLTQHMERLQASARVIGLEQAFQTEALCDAALETIRRSGLEDGYLRPLSWFDDGGLGLHAAGLASHTAIVVWDWPKVFQPTQGISLALSTASRPTPETLPPQAKLTGGYLVGFLANRMARAAGFDDCLLHDSQGCLAETSSANLFAVIDGQLITPKADRFLNGITRQTVISMAAELEIPVRETRIMPAEIGKFSEAFVTGTAVEVTPVVRISHHLMGIGALTTRLQAEYKRRVR